MSKASDITPAKFRCGLGQCSSIHETENDIILIGHHVSDGELINMGIVNADGTSARDTGDGAISLSKEFLHAFFMEYAAKLIMK